MYIKSKEKLILKYALIEIQLENIFPIYKGEKRINDIIVSKINAIINSKQLQQKNIVIDLSSQNREKKFKFFMPKEEGVPMEELIKLKTEDKEIKLSTKYLSTYGQLSTEVSFVENVYYYKRNIVVNVKIKKLYNYEDVNIDKEKIKKDIEFSSSKLDNKKTLNFGQ